MKNIETIAQIGVIIVLGLFFSLLISPFTNTLFQSFSGGIILGLFYKALTDYTKKL